MSELSSYPLAAAGVNIPAPAAPAGAPSSASPATAGASPAASAAAGAGTSRASKTTKPIRHGKQRAPSAAPVALPYQLKALAVYASREWGAVELVAIPGGGGRLLAGTRDVELDPGHWLLVRLPCLPADLTPNAEPVGVDVDPLPTEAEVSA